MSKPDIKMLRIDERLIHGQGQLWLNTLGVNLVIVANDQVTENKIQQQLMKSIVPSSIGMRFFTIEHTCDIIHKASPKQKIFIVVQSPEDALRLVAGGVEVDEINVGNIHYADGKQQVSPFISLGEEDKQSLRTLNNDYNISFDTRTSPMASSGDIDLIKYI